ncbi:hypothetical protein F5148DRAFT_1162430 [Russula earlei]|uniref:Uncharacterized protein n=1 Tax=Russula earlei TaxID=71964 RepID=A0ACC0ULD9_9AGAM|nr:hypothetical protein F5148DRAFT_1162430 [Russula earlei]
MVQQQEANSANDGELEATERYPFRIPKWLNKRHRSILEATSADWARGATCALKRGLCPNVNFSSWEDYKRHSDTAEAHPRAISFSDSCGDYLARGASLIRHRKGLPPECLNVSSDVAENECTVTQKAHEDFAEDLDGFLNSDRGSDSFRREYTPSRRRGVSRQQSRLQAPE